MMIEMSAVNSLCGVGIYILVGFAHVTWRWDYIKKIITKKIGQFAADKLHFAIPFYVALWPILIIEFIIDMVKDLFFYKSITPPCECGGTFRVKYLEFRKSFTDGFCEAKCDQCDKIAKVIFQGEN